MFLAVEKARKKLVLRTTYGKGTMKKLAHRLGARQQSRDHPNQCGKILVTQELSHYSNSMIADRLRLRLIHR